MPTNPPASKSALVRCAVHTRLLVLTLAACGVFDGRVAHADAAPADTPSETAPAGDVTPAPAPTPPDAVGTPRVLQLTLPRGAWRVDVAVAPPEAAFGGTALGEPAAAAIALGNAGISSASDADEFATIGALAEASVGVSSRVDLGLRACTISCEPARALFGLAARIRLLQSARNALGFRLQASTFGPRSTVGSAGLTWLALRGQLLAGVMPELSFRFADTSDAPSRTILGAMVPLTLAYAHPRFRVGGHVGAGVMTSAGAVAAVLPIGIDGSAVLFERSVRLEAWMSVGAAFVVGDRDDVDGRFTLGMRLAANR